MSVRVLCKYNFATPYCPYGGTYPYSMTIGQLKPIILNQINSDPTAQPTAQRQFSVIEFSKNQYEFFQNETTLQQIDPTSYGEIVFVYALW